MLVVLVLGRRLSREPGRSGFDIVASALDLVDERLHVGREAAGHEDADVKLFVGRMLLSLIKPTLEIFQHVHALRDHLVIHGVLPFVWSVGEVLAPNENPACRTTTQAEPPYGRSGEASLFRFMHLIFGVVGIAARIESVERAPVVAIKR